MHRLVIQLLREHLNDHSYSNTVTVTELAPDMPTGPERPVIAPTAYSWLHMSPPFLKTSHSCKDRLFL